MKKTILIIAILFTSNISIGQNFSELSTYEFAKTENYKSEENNVLLCTNFLFNNPSDKEVMNRLNSIQFIMKWMAGTPDHTFDLDKKAMKLTKGSSNLLSLYMAAMTKVVLENKGEPLSSDQVYHKSEMILVYYCANPKNKIKPSKQIKKIINN